MPGGILIVFAFVGLAVMVRLIAGSMDGDRVAEYVRSRGGRLLSKEWAPFGRGWVGEKDSRIYRITYEDAAGTVHRATCKTSAFSGVYFTEDEVVHTSTRPPARPAPSSRRAFASSGEPGGEDVALRLRQLDRLRAGELISAEEHAEQRQRILNGL